MRRSILIKIQILLTGLLFTSSELFPQVIVSEKTTIRVDILDKKTPAIQLAQPEIISGKTAVFEESTLKIFGKLVNSKKDDKILINNDPATITPDKFFYSNITLNPGPNDLKIQIISDDKVVNEYIYPLYYVIRQKNLSTASIAYGKYYALIMGVNNYKDPTLRDLDKPISDARSFYDVLTSKYNFEKTNVTMLPDPTRNDVINALDKLQTKLTTNDNLLIFYAGHGTYDKDSKIGFWLLADASSNSRANWISNSNLTDYLKLIKTKHTLVISDACFSGSIFVSRAASDGVPKAIEKAYELPSRQALTSGSLYEVPDNSVFIHYLLDRLDKNTEPYLTAEQLFINIKTAVQNNSDDNTQFGDIQGVGHEGGDFIFILKGQ
jgi:hypothetical protein